MSDTVGAIINEDLHSRTLWGDAWHRFKKNKLAVAGLVFVCLLVGVALVTFIIDWITHGDVYTAYVIKQNLPEKLASPSLHHLFGCDEFGRDILFRLIWGTRYSLFVGIISILFALVCGGLLGAIAGFYGGWMDNIIMRIMDVFLSIPSMVMAIAIVSALGTSTVNLLLSIGIPQIPRLARIVRASVMSVKEKEFVEATRAVGASDFHIILKYIIPNALAPIIVQASLSIGAAILAIAGLSFLGIGIQPPAPEWGSILSSARTYMRDAWHKLLSAIEKIKVGDVQDFTNLMSAVIDRASFNNIVGFIERAKLNPDIEILCGNYDDSKGYFVYPTVLLSSTPDSEPMTREIFGPVLTVYVYPDEKFDETLRQCDEATPYALTGAIFANDRRVVVKMSKALRHAAGNFYINDKPTGAVVGQQPFGGGRASGTNDKAGSTLNLYRWVNVQVTKETLVPGKEIEYPYMQEK